MTLGKIFEEKISHHLIDSLRKGIPPLFKNLALLYSISWKVDILILYWLMKLIVQIVLYTLISMKFL